MRAVVQRVSQGEVSVDKKVLASIGQGLVVLLGVAKGDNLSDVNYLVDKISNLRIFPDEDGKLNLSVKDIDGEILVVPQFTLFGDCRKGRRPSFSEAASSNEAVVLYEAVIEGLKKEGVSVGTGKFQAMMQVEIVNDGPVTILLDSTERGAKSLEYGV